jgi:hypothetical protein
VRHGGKLSGNRRQTQLARSPFRPQDPARQTAQSVRLAGQDLAASRSAQRKLVGYAAVLGGRTEIATAE